MSIQTELTRLTNAKAAIKTAIEGKGVTVPEATLLDGMASLIESIEAGGAPSLQSKSVTYTANGTATITPDSGYDGLSSVDVTVDVSGGGSETQAGRSVTFPATATRWTNIAEALLVISDGTSVHFEDYSVVAGKTINNVIAIRASSTRGYMYLKLTLAIGTIIQLIRSGLASEVYMAKAPGATMTRLGSSTNDSFMPVEDVTISAIEMHNTD